MTLTDEMTAWLGDTDLTDDQRDQFPFLWNEVAERYPDPDDHDRRDAALSAAVQYWTDEGALDRLGDETTRAYAAWQVRVAASCAAAALAIGDGQSERAASAAAGVDRQTLRKYLGKQ